MVQVERGNTVVKDVYVYQYNKSMLLYLMYWYEGEGNCHYIGHVIHNCDIRVMVLTCGMSLTTFCMNISAERK